MILGIFLGSVDSLHMLLVTFADLHFISDKNLLAANTVIAFMIVVAKLIKQNIPATAEEKTNLVAYAASQPMKANETNVNVKIDGITTPSTPGA
jgi:hypothetical protein